MRRFDFWQKWLFVISLLVAMFGLALAFFNQTPLFNFIFNARVDPVFWRGTVISAEAKDFQQWVYGILGATITGWGIFLAYLVWYPFNKKEQWAWNCIMLGLGMWFLVDTGLSLHFGVLFNAFFNTALLILAMLPLVITSREFHPKDAS